MYLCPVCNSPLEIMRRRGVIEQLSQEQLDAQRPEEIEYARTHWIADGFEGLMILHHCQCCNTHFLEWQKDHGDYTFQYTEQEGYYITDGDYQECLRRIALCPSPQPFGKYVVSPENAYLRLLSDKTKHHWCPQHEWFVGFRRALNESRFLVFEHERNINPPFEHDGVRNPGDYWKQPEVNHDLLEELRAATTVKEEPASP